MEVWSLFQGKEMEGSTKMMAKSFSENLGQNIMLQTHPGLVHYYEETGETCISIIDNFIVTSWITLLLLPCLNTYFLVADF
jgi:hypothetical protein